MRTVLQFCTKPVPTPAPQLCVTLTFEFIAVKAAMCCSLTLYFTLSMTMKVRRNTPCMLQVNDHILLHQFPQNDPSGRSQRPPPPPVSTEGFQGRHTVQTPLDSLSNDTT